MFACSRLRWPRGQRRRRKIWSLPVLVRLRPVCACARVSRLASRVPGLGEWNVRPTSPPRGRLGAPQKYAVVAGRVRASSGRAICASPGTAIRIRKRCRVFPQGVQGSEVQQGIPKPTLTIWRGPRVASYAALNCCQTLQELRRALRRARSVRWHEHLQYLPFGTVL